MAKRKGKKTKQEAKAVAAPPTADSVSVHRAPFIDLWDGRRVRFDPALQITLYWYEGTNLYLTEITITGPNGEHTIRGAQGGSKASVWEETKRRLCRLWRSAAAYPNADKRFTKALRAALGDEVFNEAPQRIPVNHPHSPNGSEPH